MMQLGKLQSIAFESVADFLKESSDNIPLPDDLTAKEKDWVQDYIQTMLSSLVRNHLIKGAPKRKTK